MTVHLGSGTRTARKQHICDLCGQFIRPGWNYNWSSQIFDNRLSTFKYHPACDELTANWDETDWECHMPGDGPWPKYAEDGSVIQRAEEKEGEEKE